MNNLKDQIVYLYKQTDMILNIAITDAHRKLIEDWAKRLHQTVSLAGNQCIIHGHPVGTPFKQINVCSVKTENDNYYWLRLLFMYNYGDEGYIYKIVPTDAMGVELSRN